MQTSTTGTLRTTRNRANRPTGSPRATDRRSESNTGKTVMIINRPNKDAFGLARPSRRLGGYRVATKLSRRDILSPRFAPSGRSRTAFGMTPRGCSKSDSGGACHSAMGWCGTTLQAHTNATPRPLGKGMVPTGSERCPQPQRAVTSAMTGMVRRAKAVRCGKRHPRSNQGTLVSTWRSASQHRFRPDRAPR